MPTTRRFPSPWTVEDYNDACFIVRQSKVPNGCTESGILGPGKVRHVAKSAISPHRSVHLGVAAIRALSRSAARCVSAGRLQTPPICWAFRAPGGRYAKLTGAASRHLLRRFTSTNVPIAILLFFRASLLGEWIGIGAF
jgi:hypothetical protein